MMILFMAVAVLPCSAQNPGDIASREFTPGELRASVITCLPGPEPYELCGHTAIRIQGREISGEPLDSIWNYGVFDFDSPNFIWRFVKGETDYMLAAYPFSRFIPQYIRRGSDVVEQSLALDQEETRTLRKLLQINALPQNCTYRYSYIHDNCATRVAAMIEAACQPRKISFPSETHYSSFRDAMRHYHRNYPWYQFGIDLALGPMIDMPMSSREEMFVPMKLEEKLAGAYFQDTDHPLVEQTIMLTPQNGEEAAVLPPTPWWETPMAAAILVLCCIVAISIWQWKKQRISKLTYSIFFGILGLGGSIIWFLVFVSTHDATSPNLLSLWLNPLQLLVPILIWWKKGRPAITALMVVDVIILTVLCCAWPFQVQSAPSAVFPLWIASLILAAEYPLIRAKEYSAIPKTRKLSTKKPKPQTRKRNKTPSQD